MVEIIKELCRMDSQQHNYGCRQRKSLMNCAAWIVNSAVMFADNGNNQGAAQLWLQTTETTLELCRMDSQQHNYGCRQRKSLLNCASNSTIMADEAFYKLR
jgi:RecG-like helicase